MKAFLLVLATLLFLPASGFGQDEPPALADPKVLLQKGLFAEEAELKLDKAALSYEEIIAQFERQRSFAVTALYRLAEVRRKQERNADAAALYQRILEEFPKADPQARLSRENLAAMGIATAPVPQKIPDDPDETKELRRLMMMAENKPKEIWGDYALDRAAEKGWLRVVTWLLDHAKKTDHELRYPLDDAARAGHLEICKLLMARGAKIEDAGGALVTTIEKNLDPVSEWLIANGVDINAIGSSYFETKSPKPKPKIIRSIRGNPAPTIRHNNCQLTPLGTAIFNDNKFWVDRLFELKADVNAVDNEGRWNIVPALSVASSKGHVPLVRRLLEAGADPNLTDSRPRENEAEEKRRIGWTALHYAVETPEIVEILLKAGADHAITKRKNITALHRAVEFAEPESVRLLLEAGADPNVRADFSWVNSSDRVDLTPLMKISRCEKIESATVIIDLLVKHGADVFAKTEDGRDVFAFGTVPENRSKLVEDHLYPQKAKEQVISLSFPDSGKVFEIASTTDPAAPTPLFARALLDWNEEAVKVSNPQYEHNFWGHRWEYPLLRRPDSAGGFSATPVDILAEGNYPTLKWGDIIEVRSNRSRDLRHDGGKEPVVKANLEYIPYQALLATLPCRFTLQLPGEEGREYDAQGGLFVPTPFSPLPNVSLGSALEPIWTQRREMWTKWKVQRSEKNGGELAEITVNVRPKQQFAHLLDGDVVKVFHVQKRSKQSGLIRLIEPQTKTLVYQTRPSIPSSQAELQKLEESAKKTRTGIYPTLFQLISESYAPLDLQQILDRGKGLPHDLYLALHYEFVEEPKEAKDKPSKENVLRALSVAVRLSGSPRYLLPHPDFSVVRIRRETGTDKGRETRPNKEEIIDVPLGEFIEACTDDTLAADCRAKDIELQPGDLVEIKAHYDRVKEPWKGFDEKTARFFEKALTYDVALAPLEGEMIKRTISWKAPTYYHTTAGAVGLRMNPEDWWSPNVYSVVTQLAGKRTNYNIESRWIRHGAEIPEVEPGSIRSPIPGPPRSGPSAAPSRSSPPFPRAPLPPSR